MQLADAPAIEMDLLYWSRHFRNMPGEGDLDVIGFMRAVAATGYDGPLSLEIFNDQFRAGLPRMVAQDGHRSLIALMDAVRRAEPALAADARPCRPLRRSGGSSSSSSPPTRRKRPRSRRCWTAPASRRRGAMSRSRSRFGGRAA